MALLLARFCRDAVEFGCVWHDSRHLPPVIGVFNRQRRVADLCGCCKSDLFAVFQSEVLNCLRDTCNLEGNRNYVLRTSMYHGRIGIDWMLQSLMIMDYGQ